MWTQISNLVIDTTAEYSPKAYSSSGLINRIRTSFVERASTATGRSCPPEPPLVSLNLSCPCFFCHSFSSHFPFVTSSLSLTQWILGESLLPCIQKWLSYNWCIYLLSPCSMNYSVKNKKIKELVKENRLGDLIRLKRCFLCEKDFEMDALEEKQMFSLWERFTYCQFRPNNVLTFGNGELVLSIYMQVVRKRH